MQTFIIAAVASLTAITPAAAAPKGDPAPVAAPAPTPVATPSATTRYCYKTEITGSRLVTRVCKTREDWKAQGVIVPARL